MEAGGGRRTLYTVLDIYHLLFKKIKYEMK